MCKDILSVYILLYQLTGNFIPCCIRDNYLKTKNMEDKTANKILLSCVLDQAQVTKYLC